MIEQVSNPPVKRIGKYKIASADMYYSEMGQREICVLDDPEQGLRIWGETPMDGAATAIDLCQIFLEYGLFCQTARDAERSYKEMRSFGENLGQRLAEYLKDTPLLNSTTDPGACALESLLEAVHAHLSMEHIGPELRFVVAGCPLLDASEHTGLAEIELAQFGFNVMCQTLIQTIDPRLLLRVPLANSAEQVFTLLKPPRPSLERPAISYVPPRDVPGKSE